MLILNIIVTSQVNELQQQVLTMENGVAVLQAQIDSLKKLLETLQTDLQRVCACPLPIQRHTSLITIDCAKVKYLCFFMMLIGDG
jgi:hypothetical protein